MTDKQHREAYAPGDRHGARQPERFDTGRAALLNDQARFQYLPPDQIFALLQAPRGGRVVDFGTGTGLFAFELARRRPDLEVIALDEQPEMLARLGANPAMTELSNVRPLHSNEISSLFGTVDAVLVINVLHELGDEATHNLAALPKPGRTILVLDWNGAIERPVGPPPDHVYTPGEASARLQRFGLLVIEEPSLPYHYVLKAQPG